MPSSASLTGPKLPPREKRSRVTFEQFFDAGAEDLAEDFAKPLGCDAACRARGAAVRGRHPRSARRPSTRPRGRV